MDVIKSINDLNLFNIHLKYECGVPPGCHNRAKKNERPRSHLWHIHKLFCEKIAMPK